MKLLVVNGPNINLLGIREKEIYGEQSYQTLLKMIEDTCREEGIEVECWQSNHEGEIVDKLQEAYQRFDGIVINAAAYSHTSIAILDAIKGIEIPAVEVHISNVYAREPFRHHSYVGMACVHSIIGQGLEGYCQAIRYFKQHYGNPD